MGTSIVLANQKKPADGELYFASTSDARSFPTRRRRKVGFDARVTDEVSSEMARALQKQIHKYSDFA